MNMEALAKAALAAKRMAALPAKKIGVPSPRAAAPAPAPALAPAPVPAPAPALAAPAPASTAPAPPLPPPPLVPSPTLPAIDEAARLRHEFISFDYDRDGVLNQKDWTQMLQKLNEEYGFMPKEPGPQMANFIQASYKKAGGRKPDPNDSDDEGETVSCKAFCKWYTPFVAQCEQRKQDEYAVTKDMSVPEYETWLKDKPLKERNRKYPLLQL